MGIDHRSNRDLSERESAVIYTSHRECGYAAYFNLASLYKGKCGISRYDVSTHCNFAVRAGYQAGHLPEPRGDVKKKRKKK